MVGKSDFNENPVVSLDLDLDLDFGLRTRVCQLSQTYLIALQMVKDKKTQYMCTTYLRKS